MSCRCRQSSSRTPRLNRATAFGLALSLLAIGGAASTSARPLDEILRDNSLNICVQQDNAPFSVERPKPSGIFLDLGDAVAKRLGVAANYTWLFSAEYVRKTSCDLIPAVAALPNDDPVRQTIPYMAVRSVLIARKDHAPILELADLRSGHTAVLATSWARHVLNAAGFPLWVRFLTNDAILDTVEQGEADAGVVPFPAYQWRLRQHPDSPLVVADGVKLDPSFDYDVSMGLRRADAATVGRFDEILRQLIEEGAMEQIFARYGLSYEPPAGDAPGSKAAATRN